MYLFNAFVIIIFISIIFFKLFHCKKKENYCLKNIPKENLRISIESESFEPKYNNPKITIYEKGKQIANVSAKIDLKPNDQGDYKHCITLKKSITKHQVKGVNIKIDTEPEIITISKPAQIIIYKNNNVEADIIAKVQLIPGYFGRSYHGVIFERKN